METYRIMAAMMVLVLCATGSLAFAQDAPAEPSSIKIIILNSDASVYGGPNSTSAVVGIARSGMKLMPISETTINGVKWYEVRVDRSTTGWIMGALVAEGMATDAAETTLPEPTRQPGNDADRTPAEPAGIGATNLATRWPLSEYGGNSFGIDIGGGGITGVNFRVGQQDTHFEIGAYLRPIIFYGGEGVDTDAAGIQPVTGALMLGVVKYFSPG